MTVRFPGWASPSLPPTDPESLDLTLDVQDAERRKLNRLVRLNTIVVPRLRVVGFALVSLAVLVHNALVPGEPAPAAWARCIAIVAAYCAVSWYALHLFFVDLRRHFDLGAVFLTCDLWIFAFVVYVTGAERSWLFFLPMLRVVDQTVMSFRRALAFAHLAPLGYLAVILYVVLVDGRHIPLGPELAKLILIYGGSLFIAMIARTADDRRRGMSRAIRLARQLTADLARKSDELEASSRELELSMEKQGRLTEENTALYAATRRERSRRTQSFESTSDGIIFVSPGGMIEAANAHAGDLLGFAPAAIMDMEMASVVSHLSTVGSGESFLPTLRDLLADSRGGQGDLLQPASGRVFHWVAQPARDGAGSNSGLTFTIQDVTRTRDLVRQLEDTSRLLDAARVEAADANRAKGEFLANVGDEIRTPLSAIIGTAQHMLDAGVRDDRLHRIQTSAGSLMAIMGDILDFSKIESRKLTLERQPFALRQALGDVIDLLRRRAGEKGLTLHLDVLPAVHDDLVGDSMRLRQVLINLIGNAIKFTDVGDVRVRVDVAAELPGQVSLHFAVIDTGIGVPRDKQNTVFEAFAQADGSASRRYGGTGLGLSISARLVELMGGDIWVESEPGKGAAFRFTARFGIQPIESAAHGGKAKPAKALRVLPELV